MRSGVNFKPKTPGVFTLDNGELFDVDAWLAQRVDRATIDALFADHVKNEETREVAHQRKLLLGEVPDEPRRRIPTQIVRPSKIGRGIVISSVPPARPCRTQVSSWSTQI
jgi:hypothetical protein